MSALTASVQIADCSCNGSNDGSVFALATGGTGPYNYLWNLIGSPTIFPDTNLITGLVPGSYTLTVTDSLLESFTYPDPIVVANPDPITITSTAVTNITCNGANNGSVEIGVAGGSGTYTFLCDNSFFLNGNYNAGPNTYTVGGSGGNFGIGTHTIQPYNSDRSCSGPIFTFTITQPAPLIGGIVSLTSSPCYPSLGSIEVEAIGGTAPYEYSFDGGAFSSTSTATGLSGGRHYYQVLDSNGCLYQSATFVITINDPIVANEDGANPTCHGFNNGYLLVAPTGGSGGYHYLWTNVDDPSQTYGDVPRINHLFAGPYNVVITDSSGCSINVDLLLVDPAIIDVTVTTTDVTCNGLNDGTVNFSITGTVGAVNYIVDGISYIEDDLPVGGLFAGTHSYSIVDANGCASTGTFDITEPTALGTTIDITSPSCYGNQGSVTFGGFGGIGPYSYQIDHGTINPKTTWDVFGGLHNVTVYDLGALGGCTFTTSFYVSEPPQIVVVPTVSNPTNPGAQDGSISLAISGGTYPLTIECVDNITYTLNAPGTIVYGSLLQGTYDIDVTDDNKCYVNLIINLTDTPAPVPPIEPTQDYLIDSLLPIANCCLGDRIYGVFSAYANGHVATRCIAIPAMMLAQKIDLVGSYYSPGQTLGGKKGIFVFRALTFVDARYYVSATGFPDVIYNGNNAHDYNWNMTAFLAALTAAGYDVEYNTGNIFMYSPMNSFYNGVVPSVTCLYTGGGRPHNIQVPIISTNGFLGAQSPCVTDDLLRCITQTQVENVTEEIRVACKTCMCGRLTNDIN